MIKKIRKMGIMIFVAVMLFTNCCFASTEDIVSTEGIISSASTVEGSRLAVGTEKLIKDVTNWLLILAPVLTACLIGYYLLRKSASDEMDTKRWDNRIKIAVISCIGVVIASGLINIIIGYYR